MSTPPTQQDAALLLQTAQWANQIGMGDAMGVVFDPEFDPESADPRDPHIRTLLAVGEMLGTLAKHDLLSAELIHDWLWIGGLWARVGPAALRAREHMGEERLYENFEALAKG